MLLRLQINVKVPWELPELHVISIFPSLIFPITIEALPCQKSEWHWMNGNMTAIVIPIKLPHIAIVELSESLNMSLSLTIVEVMFKVEVKDTTSVSVKLVQEQALVPSYWQCPTKPLQFLIYTLPECFQWGQTQTLYNQTSLCSNRWGRIHHLLLLNQWMVSCS